LSWNLSGTEQKGRQSCEHEEPVSHFDHL
jgi:hypothetical protein